MTAPASPFHDLSHYVALPRVSGLALSPDGDRLVTTVATLNRKGTGYASALWEIDPTGQGPAHRITRSTKGESGAAFAANGDLYFSSSRPSPDSEDEEPRSALWLIPARGGEARMVLNRAGGIAGVTSAKKADRVLVTAGLLPGAKDEEQHAALAKARKEGGVDAILHSGYPIRYWDHDLGPEVPHVFAVEAGSGPAARAAGGPAGSDDEERHGEDEAQAPLPGTLDRSPELRLRLLTGGMPTNPHELSPVLSEDGTFALLTVVVPQARADLREKVVRVDVATGERTTLVDLEDEEVGAGPISPDGTRAVVVISNVSSPTEAPHPRLHLMDTTTGETTPLAHDWDRWAQPVAWSPDGRSVYVLADDDGRRPVFRIDVASGEVTQVTHDDAAWSELVLAPDGTTAYGVRSSYLFPPEVVRLDLVTGTVTELPGPVERPTLPGRLEEIETTAEDGSRVRAWLALPHTGGAAQQNPMLLWIHGGPLGSWNAWSWRWCPWLLVAQGYAVLLPDPALSTGYGQDFIQRGWGAWGAAPYTDLMAITDAAEAREDIDETRTAAMGGSFGGYMANWVAGHTDRFKAIVTHASLWALDGFGPTTDAAFYWQREMTAEMSEANSPHRFVEDIVTPMLVIHGDKDYRVPIGEGLRLWYELLSRSGLPAGEDGSTVHRFLYFPQENHWILAPQHAKVWYSVVEAFLAEHVLGQEPPALPEVLGLTGPAADEGSDDD